MSDISIPGVTNSRFNTQQMIEELVELERAPIRRMESTLETHHEKKRVWQDVGRRMTEVRDASRRLYGVDNPFGARRAFSTADNVVRATASREAQETVNSIEVRQLAQADTFLSRNLDLDFRVEEGRYTFRIGERDETFTFRGGSLAEFATALNRNIGTLVRASVVRNTPNTQVISIESRITGAENRLILADDAVEFAETAGILERVTERSFDVPIASGTMRPWTEPIDRDAVSVSDGVLAVGPGGELTVPTPQVRLEPGMVMEFQARVTRRTPEEWTPPPSPPGPNIPDLGGVTLEDVTVQNVPSRPILPDLPSPEPPPIRDDFAFLFAGTDGRTVPLPEITDGEGFRAFRIPISELVDSLDTLHIRNRNTYRDIEIRNITVFDPDARGEHRPVNALRTAQDAHVRIDGIDVVRSSNVVDDLIPGVSLEFLRASPEPVSIDVQPDHEAVKDSVINFVGFYNQLLRDINILTRSSSDIISEIEYFSPEEREQAERRLGLLQGDNTLNQVKSRLQMIAMNPYETRAGADLRLLAQIGISTNAGPIGSRSFDANRLRGYLEINEPVLDQALRDDFQAVRDLFGRDTDGDFVIDSGAAYELQNFMTPFVQSGGIITTRTSTIDTQVARTERDIENYERRIERYEADLRRQYARMEGALDSMESQSRALDNFSSQQNRR